MTSLAEKIVAIERDLAAAELPHAFGGALALAFHVEEPRATRDIDVNVFVPASRTRDVLDALPAPIARDDRKADELQARGQVRLLWDENPVDVFLSTHPFHDEAAARVIDVPFAGITLPVLGATELVVFKAFFDRTKDWADIEAMLAADTVDGHRALGWLVDLLGADDERVDRFRRLLSAPPPAQDPRFDPGR
jgi:hypothetical protein